ncbi:elongation factor G [Methylovirgula sp. HY1]|uniref:elongation factor G n=1 Tax=Methylovirgula sp. HY1 TaxID=2822761 RepID=UPI001C5A8A09|nr:elongation factor G [Methylovirgula sp. HY1]QXX73406.1 Elongation factor G [Methylovirgula sp. HY1]
MTRSAWKAEPAGPRSIALVGPYGSGKSTLFDALMTCAGAPVKRCGDTRSRSMSTELRLGHCHFLDEPWAILDCPGSVEFAYDTLSALMVCDLAVVVCEPSPERMASVTLLMKILEDHAIPHLVFINKIDMLAGRVRDSIAALQNYSNRPMVLRQVPIREADAITGYVDVVSERAYRYRREQDSELISLPNTMQEREREARAGLSEVLADHDDAILEKILEDVAPSSDELFRQLHHDQASGSIVQVLLGSATQGFGILRLWKALRHDAPNAWETAQRHGIAVSDQPLVQIFKTAHAGQAAYTGKLSLSRIWRGTLMDGATLNGNRVGGIHRFVGGEPVRVASANAGELVALGRLENCATGAVLGLHDSSEVMAFPEPPAPVFALVIATKDRKDDVKLSTALHKLVEEDPSISVVHEQATGETLLRGQGEVHLNVALERLATNYNLQINVGTPKIAFKETIRREVHQHARLKRQTGGHGQFADVKLEICPRERGAGFSFTDKIVGGAVPKQYIPAVREASEEAMQKGPFGYPVVDVGVTLVDGSFHSVDSSDMAFRTATRIGIGEALAKAEPVLLEPIDHVTVSVPNQFTAGVQRLLSGRRGQILGYAERPGWPGWDDVEALVPEAELHDFILQLRSDTMGLGSYRKSFDHLAEARGKLAH